MRTKEVAEICGVSIQTVVANAREIGKEIKHGVATEWSEEDLKKLQLVLMRNAQNAGGQKTEGSVVKEQCQSSLTVGLSLQEIIKSGNVEAIDEYMGIVRNATIAQHDLMIEQQKNQLLIEQNLTLQKEVDKYVQWMSASQIKKEFNLPVRPGVAKVAQLLGLQREKDWIEKSYGDDTCYSKILYSPEAVQLIVEWYLED